MSSVEVLTIHQWEFDNRYYCTCGALMEYDGQADVDGQEAMAAHVLDALKAAGYAVELRLENTVLRDRVRELETLLAVVRAERDTARATGTVGIR